MIDEEVTPEIQEKLNEMVLELGNKRKILNERADKIEAIHESLVIFEKLDISSLQSWLIIPAQQQERNLVKSFYGRVLNISNIDSADPVLEARKQRLKRDSLISFNPDSAYSLNITLPIPLPEIWVIAVDNILTVDNAIEYESAVIQQAKTRLLFKEMQAQQQVNIQRAAQSASKSLIQLNKPGFQKKR